MSAVNPHDLACDGALEWLSGACESGLGWASLASDLTACSMYYIIHARHCLEAKVTTAGEFIRERREDLRREDARYSLRQVAERIGIEPSYLSKVERDIGSPPSEDTLVRLADDLGLDRDVLLALAGKISSDLREAIRRRPRLFGELIRQLKDMPDRAVLRLVREVRDGEW
jgi:HTH-type transcriptional regulator, competence development regulator